MSDKCPSGTGVGDKEYEVVIVQNRGHEGTDGISTHEGRGKGV